MARSGHSSSAWLLLAAAVLFATGAAAQTTNCSSASFPAGRSFHSCISLPVLGASIYYTYHAENGTADVAFRGPSGTNGWVAWGINTEQANSMSGSSVFIATQNGNGVVTVLPTFLESTAPSLTPGNLRFNVSGAPAAEYSAGAYTIYVTVALPGNSTVQNTVWQAGPLVNGQISPHPMSAPNLQSTMRLDFLPGGNRTTAGAPNSTLPRRNLREFQG
ncbi:hypothetical protein PR202_ga26748 [Eleusine coracana subsp. coracana]|uniref:DOMON domain-containing protein n=1 Tax=Eleusine coracana subsp. coracana TaxID=191504 RepID=A0AAV5DE48_ELECO|nr:hypothetical protein QOZ80_3AG0237210 [Eleusine coracana subsp. coracana]GJN08792.1 hypothetical protein PR202_ga26748 [Eleusine coracana subsp. coracana]